MAWESRGNNQYYYSSERVNGRVVKRYLGRAEWTTAAAWLAQHDKRQREEEWQERREQRRAWQEEDSALKDACRKCGRLAELYLNACGYYRHDRGAFRKQRVNMGIHTDGYARSKAIEAARDRVPETTEERVAIIRAALDDKKKEALAVACIQKHPGELTCQSLDTLGDVIDRCCGNHPVVAALIRAEVDKKRPELLGPNPSPLERLLVDRVLATQIHLGRVETWYGACWEKGGTVNQAAHWDKRLASAQRMYLQAVKALAEVRKLQTPSVAVALPGSTQVSIDKQLIVHR